MRFHTGRLQNGLLVLRFYAGRLCLQPDAGEILGQIITMNTDLQIRIGHVVMMGIGEPLDNYENVVRFIRMARDTDGLGISCRNLSLSTCGLAERIVRLSEEGLPVTLSVSLPPLLTRKDRK